MTETLAETVGVLKVRVGRSAAERALGALMGLEDVGWEETCDLAGAYRICREHKTRSLVDALVIQACLRLRMDLLTFDEDQDAILAKLRPGSG